MIIHFMRAKTYYWRDWYTIPFVATFMPCQEMTM